MRPAATVAEPETSAAQSDTPAAVPLPPSAKAKAPSDRADTPGKAPPVKPAVTPPAPAVPAEKTVKPAAVPAGGKAAKPAAASPAPVAAAEKAPKPASEVPAPAQPPALDLAALEKRLKETNAIGVFTKLTLKNQVDDLLNRFKAFYEGRLKTTLAELRQPYDLLILKVLTLLQDGDPTLARAVHDSREAIWGILSDPAKFSKLQG